MTLLKQGKFFSFFTLRLCRRDLRIPVCLLSSIINYNSNVKELLFIILLCKKDKAFLLSLALFKEDIALCLCRWVFC